MREIEQKPTPVDGVVIREGAPTLLSNKDIKPTDERLYTQLPRREWEDIKPKHWKELLPHGAWHRYSRSEVVGIVYQALDKIKELNT